MKILPPGVVIQTNNRPMICTRFGNGMARGASHFKDKVIPFAYLYQLGCVCLLTGNWGDFELYAFIALYYETAERLNALWHF